MSQGPAESVGNTREGQFGAIGTKREQWQMPTGATTQPPSSSSVPNTNSFTATPNNTTTSTGL